MNDRSFLSDLSLNTVARKRNLVSDLAEAISREIAEGRLQAGDRLPTEAELAAAAGVSRTVVREAVAALKAAKLVQTRQGAGAFVLPPPPKSDFFASLSNGEVDDILAMLELRLAVEVEAASLAAVRRTDEEMAALDRALENITKGEDYGIAADLEFHRILAGATKNPYFARFLDFLGEFAVPRRSGQSDPVGMDQRQRDYLSVIEREHRAIRDAIAMGDSNLAAAMMRAHLANSRNRYSARILQASGKSAAKPVKVRSAAKA
ncbi:FadR/GntR family transcriptional regulator [Microvirga lotononidis]|uniref:Transcriptional regulator n=1 Tax=Microvirga lotononidis TaxID=864069 RepID=I4YYJ8_9HYPH|nr:FadR/GntR family transcriptional regulator [Microvirga lotononidis]EIM29040.1 transcriptional regulator [Microvirga lotononidis]WQO28886.1 FadR/GntR family transcriptional regulator [Microvirga lotononidis]